MSTRTSALVEKITPQLEAVSAHLDAVEEAAEEKGHELVKESIAIARVCVQSLEEAISEERLEVLPVPALAQIVKLATDVANATTNVAGNFDGQAGNFTNLVDSLHNRLWADRLISASAEAGAYQSAAGKLDDAMIAVRRQIEELREGLEDRKRVEEAAKAAEVLRNEVTALANESRSEKARIAGLLNEATTAQGAFSTKATEINTLLEQAKASRAAVTSLEAELKKWHGEIGTRNAEISALKESTEARLKAYDGEIETRKETLDGFESRIREQFSLASSGALAESFSQRGEKLYKGTIWWGRAAWAAYVGFVGFAVWAMIKTIPEPGSSIDVSLFLVRISVAIPIGLLVWFVTVQYGRARRIQESYAFKGVVASSFDAYRDLVAKIATDETLKADPKYAEFIRETIERIYAAPPMGKEEDDNPPHTRLVRDLPGALKEVADFTERIKRL